MHAGGDDRSPLAGLSGLQCADSAIHVLRCFVIYVAMLLGGWTVLDMVVCVVDRTAGEVCSGIINKCLNQRAKTKDLGMAILMMYIEIEKQDIVQV